MPPRNILDAPRGNVPVQAGLALNPEFNMRRYSAGAASDNPTFRAQRERVADGLRKAGVPEG